MSVFLHGIFFTCRLCYVTSESTIRTKDFLHEINQSCRIGTLTCGFPDKELACYFQNRKRIHGPMKTQFAVQTVGLQEDGSWVLGKDCIFDEDGKKLDQSTSNYIWIGHLFRGIYILLFKFRFVN